jgi:hypothetical protein
MPRSFPTLFLLAGLLSALAYGLAAQRLAALPRVTAKPELLIALPRFAQVLLAAGDRYLAANLAGFRVLVAETARMSADDYAVQATLQRDIAWFNPAHEDNYYIAAAILPWNDQVDAAQYVLRKAADARSFDWYPLFHYGFLFYHFHNDPAMGAQWLLKGVPRVRNPQDEWALQNVAAAWIEKGYDTANAAGLVAAMAENAPRGAFRNYLQVRADRLRDLATLQAAAQRFRDRFGREVKELDELVSSGLITEIPTDALGFGFGLDASGRPKLRSSSEGQK